MEEEFEIAEDSGGGGGEDREGRPLCYSSYGGGDRDLNLGSREARGVSREGDREARFQGRRGSLDGADHRLE